MPDEMTINSSRLRLVRGDLTDMDMEAFVFYARDDLELGSGFGTAITLRGGPTISEELKKMKKLEPTHAVVSSAGELKARYIIHANGPKFQEKDMEGKLEKTILNSLKQAEKKGIKSIAFPPMGAGFYGVPLPTSAKIMIRTISEYLAGETKIEDIVICLIDNRELKAFQEKMKTNGKEEKL
ncbi:MAG: macro domain-containing protein [Pseudomonadota bacterium]